MNRNGLPPHSHRSKRRSKSEIQKILEDYRQSGLSQREFAAREQISLSNLQWWLRQARRKSELRGGPRWLEVSVPPSTKAPKRGLTYQIALSGGVVNVPAGFDPQELKQLLDVIGAQL